MAKDLSFSERFGKEPSVLVRSPGRVNLIGEHTDYNLGYVLPVAIDRYTKLAASPRADRKLNVYSETMGQGVEIDLDGVLDLMGESQHWANYVRGTAWWMEEHDYHANGADVLIWGDLPVGAGLSSSASVLLGMLGTMSSLAGWNIPRPEMARAAHKIESEFLGVPVGMMDQTVIAQAEAKSALMIDCRSMVATTVPLNLDGNGLSMVVVDSGMSREVADSAYGRRRRECEAALGAMRVITYNLELQSLRDVDSALLQRHGSKLYPTLFKRARHVITENERVLKTVSSVQAGDYEEVGRLMNESHESLRTDFEVSNPFMDRLVDLAHETPGVLGARLTGAGFGGCTVNLVRTEALRDFNRNVVRRYSEETSLKAESFLVKAVGGIEMDRLVA
ncbi:MAG: galactokinase [Chloroflexia bacterium]